jgi:hypothetical protein
MCWCQKTWFFDEVKNRPKNTHFEPLFQDPQKTAIFDHFSCVGEFWWFHDVLTTNFDDEMMLMMCWWWCRWRKNLIERLKIDENWPSAEPKKKPKWSPERAARNRGAEGSQGAFMTRSREAELANTSEHRNTGMVRRVRA